MEYREFEPPPTLAPLLKCLWTLEGSPPDTAQDPIFPDGSPEIIFNLGDSFRAFGPSGELVDQPLAMLVGQITAPFTVYASGNVRLVGMRLHPFGGAVLTDDMSQLTNQWTSLKVDWPPQQGTVGEGRDAALAAAIAVVLPLVEHGRPVHPHVQEACNAIRDARGNIALDELATSLGTTSRTLQRRFAREVGIGPKLLARITRFQNVFSAWREDPGTLARVAADCGYFDQSHLVRDFRDFAGDAPAAALTEQAQFTAFFLP